MPAPFYLTCAAIIAFAISFWRKRREGWGIPACVVLITVSVWYVGDVIYNDLDVYLETIGAESLTSAWWQVLWFILVFGLLAGPVHRLINRGLSNQSSHVIAYMESDGLLQPEVQQRISVLGGAMLAVWLVLMAIAIVMVKGDVVGLFAPYLGHKAEPWARGQIGGGFSALISLAAYLQIFLTAAFGVLAAVAMNPKTRIMALGICFLTLPYFIFDRTRNVMLATLLPGLFSFVFMRMKGGLLIKGLFLIGAFLLIVFWFTFVMANRTGSTIAGAFQDGANQEIMSTTKHEGLNMFEELAWIDSFIVTNVYVPNKGERYFAELVNPIPRALWKDKPMIGLDYAVARGQMALGPEGEVTATISTGMIGQGVVNFGRFFGPAASAFLMALWVAVLARQDLKGINPGRLVLYACGLILTFNMGRDITLLVVYPFIFGWVVMWSVEKKQAKTTRKMELKQELQDTGGGGR